jgi:hypothetical protein
MIREGGGGQRFGNGYATEDDCLKRQKVRAAAASKLRSSFAC